MSLFWKYIFFFRYFFIMLICNCFWIISLWIFWNSRNFISNLITNQITSCLCCFLNDSLRKGFKYVCCKLFNVIKRFLDVFTTQVFTYVFSNIFNHIFSKRQKSIAFHKYSISWLNWIAHYFLCFRLLLMTKVMFILSFISNGLEFWSVNYFSMW